MNKEENNNTRLLLTIYTFFGYIHVLSYRYLDIASYLDMPSLTSYGMAISTIGKIGQYKIR